MVDTSGIEQALRDRARQKMIEASDGVRRDIEHDAPRQTGKLSTLIRTTTTEDATSITTKVVTEARSADGYDYGQAQDQGTGVYVGRGRIYPIRARALVFFWPKVGRMVAFKSVKGTPPTKFFTRNVERWRDRLQEAFRT